MSFGDNMKKERFKRGLTQQEAADLIGIPKVNLNAYEQGYAEPKMKVLRLIIEKYEVKGIRKFLFK